MVKSTGRLRSRWFRVKNLIWFLTITPFFDAYYVFVKDGDAPGTEAETRNLVTLPTRSPNARSPNAPVLSWTRKKRATSRLMGKLSSSMATLGGSLWMEF